MADSGRLSSVGDCLVGDCGRWTLHWPLYSFHFPISCSNQSNRSKILGRWTHPPLHCTPWILLLDWPFRRSRETPRFATSTCWTTLTKARHTEPDIGEMDPSFIDHCTFLGLVAWFTFGKISTFGPMAPKIQAGKLDCILWSQKPLDYRCWTNLFPLHTMTAWDTFATP